MHKTKVSRAVRALEEKRWLKRSADADDRRVEHLELTAAGKGIYGEMIALAHEYERELSLVLGARSMSELVAGLTAIEAKLPPVSGRKGPQD